MKKFFLIFAVILFSISMMAAPHLQSKKLVKVDTDTAVSIVYAEEDTTGIIGIVWQADSTLSKAYDIQLGLLDTVAMTYSLIADLASYSRAFAIDGYDGYFSISTDLILKYGDNYSTISDYGADEATVAKWQAAWEASVNESDFTLKVGTYIIFVEGIDLSFNTTEEYDYAIIEIANTTSGIEDVNVINESFKYLDTNTGNLYILRDGKKYNILGTYIVNK